MGSLGFMVAREVQDVWGHFQKCEANVVEGGRLSLLINISWCHCQGSDIVGDLLSHANVPFQNGRNQKREPCFEDFVSKPLSRPTFFGSPSMT